MKSKLNTFFLNQITSFFFKKSSIVAAKGQSIDSAYIVNKGKLALISGNDLVDFENDNDNYVELEEGEIFGDVLLLTKQTNPMTCIAAEDSEVIIISKEQFYDRIDRADGFIQLLIELLTKRVSYFIHP